MSTMADTQGRRGRRSFTDDYKTGAVRLVLDEGKTVASAARDAAENRPDPLPPPPPPRTMADIMKTILEKWSQCISWRGKSQRLAWT